jgi:glycosyltransferase involved in cell wall biosynthesis
MKHKKFVKSTVSSGQVKTTIIMLANGHKPFDTRIFVKEARTLSLAGYNVSIIVPHTANEKKDGIAIIAVPLTSGGFYKLVVNPWRIFRKALAQPKNAVFCIHDSDILIVGILLKMFGRKVVYDAHEDTPLQIAYQHWLPAILKKPYAWFYYGLENICGKMFDAIIVAEPVIAKYFPPGKTYLLRNFPTTKQFSDYPLPEYTKRKNAMVYVGTLSKVRGLFEMLEASKRASKQTKFEFVLGGDFAPASLQQEVLANFQVTFLKWVSYNDLVKLLFESKIGIIIPNPIERYKTNYPVKLFEFMAAGIPVIASSAGESAAFVIEAQCGILVDPLNIREIADAIEWLFKNPDESAAMGKRGRDLIFNKYNWEMESKVLLDVYSRL